jgi:metallo-beta-lactamase class B
MLSLATQTPTHKKDLAVLKYCFGILLVAALTECTPAASPVDAPASATASASATVATSAPAAATAAPASDAAAAHVAKAQQLAGADLTQPLVLCKTTSEAKDFVLAKVKADGKTVVPPTKLFDNLFFVGNEFVGVFALKTSAGLILFDSLTSTEDVKTVLEPGLKQLGLAPKDIRDVVVTHGHFDHFGGAAYLQKTYGAHVLLSAADWQFIEHQKQAPGVGAGEVPKHDLEVTDGQVLTLGDTSVTLYLTPGHTPGTVSAILPAIDQGKPYKLALFGSVLFPEAREPSATNGGLAQYQSSIQHFDQVSDAARVDGILNTHIFIDGTAERLAAARKRTPGQPNPFLIGTANAHRYHEILGECVAAALARLDATPKQAAN